MMTPDALMRQAAMTADLYAREGAKVYRDIFGLDPAQEPESAAVFIAAFMRTSAHDFDVGMRENRP